MFAKFNTITNDLYALGKLYTLTELVNKILIVCPKHIKAKW